LANFKAFTDTIHARYAALQQDATEFFVVDVPDLYESYLAAFPQGTNPILRERAEHDCNTCKNFIRNLGKVVTIKDGVVSTVWDVEDLEEPYATVAASLNEILLAAPIAGVFRTAFSTYGGNSNIDNHNPDIRWYHFYGKAPAGTVSGNPQADAEKINSVARVFLRGLKEFRQSDLDQVLGLIDENSIYRGKEFQRLIEEFRRVQAEYIAQGSKDIFAWEHCHNSAARFRNTAIGKLFVDLAKDDPLEVAVAKFEDKVSEGKYKRTTALITPKMIEEGLAELRALGLEDAVKRRLARLEDLSVKDVLFVDNSVASVMKDNLANLLLASSSTKKRTVKESAATDVSIIDFIKRGFKSIELVLSNQHLSNFVALTAPEHEDAKPLFKWNNGYGWSYDGEVADSLRQRVESAGGRTDGPFRFTNSWNHEGRRNASLMDLHVLLPGCAAPKQGCQSAPHGRGNGGKRVGWDARTNALTGAAQDVDYVSAAPAGYVPIENISFPDKSRMPEGPYECYIHNWSLRAPNNGGFKAQLEVDGVIFDYDYPKPVKQYEWIHVATVTLKSGEFSVEHRIPSSATSREKWGVKTLEPVKVQTILLSPNHWEGAGEVGNKHWFFVLEGCKVDVPVRGFYNEFLVNELTPHRKVFEVLGSQLKCQPADSQLSGVGFSETRRDVVAALADGRPFNIHF
jgi:hypothetical protein